MASQPAAGTRGIECLEVSSIILLTKEPENGEMLELKRERENCKYINAVAFVKGDVL